MRNEDGPKTLVLDIERIRGWARVPFWDLGDYKRRRIHPSNVEEWPRTVCAAWRWRGSNKVEFAAEWERGGRRAFLRRVWKVYNEADVIVGHNIDAFDTKKLATEWLLLGLTPPAPFQSVDTLKEARAAFGFECNTLASLTERLGITTKTGKYDPEAAERAVAGDLRARAQLRSYNRGDIPATDAVYERLLPWMKKHPNVGMYRDGAAVCPKCGSGKIQSRGWVRTRTRKYQRFACVSCGAWGKARESEKGAAASLVSA